MKLISVKKIRSLQILNPFLLILLITVSISSHASRFCDPNQSDMELCNEMRHLRSQVLVLGAQRDLHQINFPYLLHLAREVNSTAQRATLHLQNSQLPQVELLSGVVTASKELEEFALQKNPDALIKANNIQTQCRNCHAQDNPISSVRWNEIFKNDWSVYYQRCNEKDRNPYLCKSMYGLLSSVSTFSTSQKLKIQNFETYQLGAQEMARIATDLIDKQFLHSGMYTLSMLKSRSQELETLAANHDPATFTKAASLTDVCLQCHESRPTTEVKSFLNRSF